jgi:hypothetical protein
MHLTRRQMMNLEGATKPGFGPVDERQHIRHSAAESRAVVRPDFDTRYNLRRAVIALFGRSRDREND